MAYLESVDVIQEYVTVLRDFDDRNLIPFIRRANRKYLQPYVGGLYAELLEPATGENADIKNEARALFEESLCSFSFYVGSAELSLQISNSGISTHSSTEYTKADSFDKNDFSRQLLRNGHEALDVLLKHLQENNTLFTSYTTTLQDKYKDFMVQDTATFQKYYNIQSSRQAFIALLPTMRQVEDQYLTNFICTDFITRLKTKEVTGTLLEVKENLQKAIVAFTVSQTVYEGQFILDGQGIHLKFDRLPHEVTATNVKINEFLKHTHEAKQKAGVQYLKNIERIVTDNPTDFTDCDGVVLIDNSSDAKASSQIVTNNRIIAL